MTLEKSHKGVEIVMRNAKETEMSGNWESKVERSVKKLKDRNIRETSEPDSHTK